MNFTRQQHQSHEITKHMGGSSVFCFWVLGISFLLTDIPLPGLDSGRPVGSGMFPPAARSPAGRGRLGMTYETQGTVWGRMCLTGGGEHGRRRGGVAAVSGHRCSRRRAGEHEQVRRARAPVSCGETIWVPGWAGGQTEGAVDGEVELGRLRWEAARGGGDSG
jgi:hypothetical protein